MVNAPDFAKRLQKILEYYGLSATAFSEELNVNRSTISHLLSGRNKPSLEFVMKVLQKYPEVELYWLLNGKGNFPRDQRQLPPTEQKLEESTSDEKISTVIEKKRIRKDDSIEKIIIFYKDGRFKVYEN